MTMSTRMRALVRAVMTGAMTFVFVATSATLGTVLFDVDITEAKTPGSTYCFYGKCHRVKTLGEMQGLVGKTVSLHSSHYDSCHRDRYNPCGLTSSGEPFFADRADNAASPIYPDGTKLLVWSPSSKEAAVIRINNAGPYWGNRKLDVSRALARKLGFERRGVAKLETRVLSVPTKKEARYKRNRRYAKVQGPIGKFESLDQAEKGVAVLHAFEAMTTAALAPSGANGVVRVQRPFEVAAQVTQGRAFAEVRPALKTWPVVQRQYARVTWPVVETPTAKSDKAPVRVAGLAPPVQLSAWPVVRGDKVDAKGGQRSSAKLARMSVPQPPKAKRKRKASRLAAVVRKAKRRKTSRSRKRVASKTSKRKAASRAYRPATDQKRATVRRIKTARVSGTMIKQTKTTTAKKRPYVAVRQIHHRLLGRHGA